MWTKLCTFSLLIGLTFAKESDYIKFPPGFEFGVATASYQVEGGWNADGKGENIWDRLTHTEPQMIKNESNGDVACDSYHKYEEDVKILQDMGVHFYRFSLSWSRIFPTGFSNYVNKAGVAYYHKLIDKLLERNITPMITLFHWDLPQPLQDLGGLANPDFKKFFAYYANFTFHEYGDKVKLWITFNEPVSICLGGYGSRGLAPALDNSGIASYLCGHNLLLAHEKAYRVYDKHYRKTQNGKVGISLDSLWFEPNSTKKEDQEAAERALHFHLGWFAHPIFTEQGDYPPVMKKRIGERSQKEGFPRSRLPQFCECEIKDLKGSADFFGLNHYSTNLAANKTEDKITPIPSYSSDQNVRTFYNASWPNSTVSWLKVAPWGFRKILKWIKDNYNNPMIYVTENGMADNDFPNDTQRINYYHSYLKSLLTAIDEDKVNVQKYTAWSIMDNFEWESGYTVRFGLYHVDFNDPARPRTPKKSAGFYKTIIKDHALPKTWPMSNTDDVSDQKINHKDQAVNLNNRKNDTINVVDFKNQTITVKQNQTITVKPKINSTITKDNSKQKIILDEIPLPSNKSASAK